LKSVLSSAILLSTLTHLNQCTSQQ